MTVTIDDAPAPDLTELCLPEHRRGPAWLARIREETGTFVREHGLPTRKDEDWRYTRLAPITNLPFQPPGPTEPSRSALTTVRRVPILGGIRLVFVNGRFDAGRSNLSAVPSGAIVTNLASALGDHDDDLQPFFVGRPHSAADAFADLNTTLAEDGAFVRLSPGVVVDHPIEILFLSDPGSSIIVASPKSFLWAGANSQATVVETHLGVPGGQGGTVLTNAVSQLLLEEEARIELFRVQDEPHTSSNISLLDVCQNRKSRFTAHSFAFGGSIGRHEIRVRLEGESAEVHLNGLSMSRAEQQHDNPLFVEHLAPRCTSRQLYKSIVDGNSHSVFNGHIVVRPGGAVADAQQTNKNLLLSDQAEVDTRPRLEILTDDVKCSHGATVGRLDDDALFYLTSRGIPSYLARRMLVTAFAKELVARIDIPLLHEWVEQLVKGRLGPNETASAGEAGGSE